MESMLVFPSQVLQVFQMFEMPFSLLGVISSTIYSSWLFLWISSSGLIGLSQMSHSASRVVFFLVIDRYCTCLP